MSICFLDTEFTDLNAPRLLSIGMTSKTGAEFYSEIDLGLEEGQLRRTASTDFVQDVVLSQWGMIDGAEDSYWGMGRRAAEWLIQQTAERGAPIEVAYDYEADFELLAAAIHNAGLWDQVSLVVRPVNIDRLIGTIEGELALETAFGELRARRLFRHHALADAIALREAYMAVARALSRRAPRT